MSAAESLAISLMSAPAQKALSLPVRTTHLTESSASSASRAATSSRTSTEFRALRASGLLILTVATGLSTRREMVW